MQAADQAGGADGGTLFLDEVGDLAAELQAKLLRFLECGEVRPVGSVRARQADVRVLAATNRDLAGGAAGRFRSDLYFRLNQVRIRTVPLCEMPDQIASMATRLLARARRREGSAGPTGARFAPATLEAMARYGWPGNVRELINAVERSRIMAGGETILPDDLPEQVRGSASIGGPGGWEVTAPGDLAPLSQVERAHILKVLESCGGNKAAAARTLDINLRTLYNKLAQMQRQ